MKLKRQFVDAVVKAHIASIMNDASSGIMFERQLEQVLAKVFEVMYRRYDFREFFPVSTEVNEGAQTFTYYIYDRVGIAKIIGSIAKDLPRVDVSAKRVILPLRQVGDSFGYTTEDIRAAQFGGVPLEQRKANAAREAVEALLHSIAWNGDEDSGLPGMLTNPNITESVVVNGANSTPGWTTKTADEILFDINDITSDIDEVSKGRFRANTLAIPRGQFNYITSTPRASNSDTTIKQFVLNNNEFLQEIKPSDDLNGTGTGGADLMMAYDKSPENMEYHEPMPLRFLPVQIQGLEFLIPAEAKTGGLAIYQPLSVLLRYGI